MEWIIRLDHSFYFGIVIFKFSFFYEKKIYYFLSGLIIGFFIYSVYNLTNYSTIQDYSVKMTIIDYNLGISFIWICSLDIKLFLKIQEFILFFYTIEV